MNTIYTVGYNAGWTPELLRRELDRHNAILLDIRANPTSSRAEWRRAAMAAFYGTNYFHQPALGNLNYATGGPIKLANPERAADVIGRTLKHCSIALLCGCRDVHACHRKVAAEFLAERLGAPVEHLEPPVETKPGALKVITVRQPWAWAMFLAPTLKDIENRDWSTTYRGRLAIHAGKSMTLSEYRTAIRFMHDSVGIPWGALPRTEDLVFGAVLGTVELVNCTDDQYDHDSPWFMGRYGFVLRNPRRFEQPIPARGMQGLWDWVPPKGVLL